MRSASWKATRQRRGPRLANRARHWPSSHRSPAPDLRVPLLQALRAYERSRFPQECRSRLEPSTRPPRRVDRFPIRTARHAHRASLTTVPPTLFQRDAKARSCQPLANRCRHASGTSAAAMAAGTASRSSRTVRSTVGPIPRRHEKSRDLGDWLRVRPSQPNPQQRPSLSRHPCWWFGLAALVPCHGLYKPR